MSEHDAIKSLYRKAIFSIVMVVIAAIVSPIVSYSLRGDLLEERTTRNERRIDQIEIGQKQFVTHTQEEKAHNTIIQEMSEIKGEQKYIRDRVDKIYDRVK